MTSNATRNAVVAINATAAARTLNTTELLEQIFTSLMLDDLAYAQRVNWHWHDVIQTSPKLRPNLYLTAAPCLSYLYYTRSSPDGEDEPRLTAERLEDDICAAIVKPHPAFQCHNVHEVRLLSMSIGYADLVRWGSGLMKDVLITQPAWQQISFQVRGKGGEGRWIEMDGQGIRIGALRARAMEEVARLRANSPTDGWQEVGEEEGGRMTLLLFPGGRREGVIHKDSKYVRQARTERDSKADSA
ncbi:hypothetical protein LTR36_000506 [Oleoguttula mirabilis]|uniref:F-box domain-containing protein n=1 Tax=Oleoguttula mirabilis TaxID=1507867 RepID=A0AAV9JRD2_9PEZI|nr:hypothetical protein LTR36_000506 [Oleoguttula mirabilis]